MPKVTQPVARKDYPEFGIVKGQKHYQWVLKTGPRSSREYRQAMPPKRSQLTSSDFLQQLYTIFDEQVAMAETPDDLRQAASELENLGSEQREKYDNMPEGLQQGPTGQMLEERADGCESAASTIESAADDLESALEEIDSEEVEAEAAKTDWDAYKESEPDEADAEAYKKWQENEPDVDRPDGRDFDADREEAIAEAVSTATDAEAECNI